jgi:GNAT superfamily N-acetyltransferase
MRGASRNWKMVGRGAARAARHVQPHAKRRTPEHARPEFRWQDVVGKWRPVGVPQPRRTKGLSRPTPKFYTDTFQRLISSLANPKPATKISIICLYPARAHNGLTMTDIFIRALKPAEWLVVRDFRLASLKDCPGAFALSYDEAATWSPEQWQAEISAPTHQIFGMFDGGVMIGITAAFTWRGDPTGKTALLAMSYILPLYRGRGLSRLLYEARLRWIRRRPKFEKVIVSHRASNETSRRANQRHGFVRMKAEPHKWRDDVTEDEIFYELEIAR